jgi:hypothetical protein
MRERFLFNDAGIEKAEGVMRATLPRAVADMLYFHPRKYLDADGSALINWRAVRMTAQKVGYSVALPATAGSRL